MIGIGLIGLGFMGRMHLGAYRRVAGAKIVAIADVDPKRAAGALSGGWGNVAGAADSIDMTGVTGATDWRRLLELDAVQVIDICVPTPAHVEVATAALQAGKHVICEKPLAMTSAQAQRIADAADRACGIFMPAMCMRFWPQWAWLKQAVDEGRYGKVLGASFTRIGGPPGGWFRDGNMSGGAVLDLHIHDTDFVSFLFGPPRAVFSRGYSLHTGVIDHVSTQYVYDAPPLVLAEGGWLAEGYPFGMRYVVNFEQATADFTTGREQALMVTAGGQIKPVELSGDGYEAELAYFVRCVQEGRRPQIVTAADAVMSIRIVEAEVRSIGSGRPEPV